MIKKYIILFFLHFAGFSFAQQRPHYTQYLQNMEVINPGYTGIENDLIIKTGFRNQWLGLKDAPITNYLTLHTALNKKDRALSLSTDTLTEKLNDNSAFRIDSIDSINFIREELYPALNNFHGAGIVFLNDKTGPINRSTINLVYAYHLKLNQKMNLSFGLGGGVSRINLNADALEFDEPNDPVVMLNQNTIWTPDINIGTYLYSKRFYFGASLLQVIKERLSFSRNFDEGKQVPHLFVTTGYQFKLKPDVFITPSIMLKYVKPLPSAFDVNLKFEYQNRFWFGSSFRSKDAVSGLFGIKINKNLDVGYAYDSNINSLQSVSSSSHEIVIGYKITK